MSYILDALRKADAQRERDPTRGIHAQPARAAIGQEPQSAGYRLRFWVVSAAGLSALSGAGGWYIYRDPPSSTGMPPIAVVAQAATPSASPPPPLAAPALPAPVVVAQAVMPPPVVIAPPVGTAPQGSGMPNRAERARGSMAPVSAPVAQAGPPPAVAPASPAASTPPGTAPASASASASTPPPAPAPTPTPAPAPAPAPAPTPFAAPGAVPAAPPVPPVVGLPPDAPKLVISGGVYSTGKAQRMLIVNGQVVREGADLGSGVTLEEIRAKTAVLGFRGARYTVAY